MLIKLKIRIRRNSHGIKRSWMWIEKVQILKKYLNIVETKKYLDIVETINSELFGELSKGTSTKFESSSWIFKSSSSSLSLSSINIDQYHDHNDHEDLLSCCCDRSGISQLQLRAVVPRQQPQRNPLMTMMMMMMMINYTDDIEMMKLVMMM